MAISMTVQSPNEADRFQLVENYVDHIIDGMDMDCLVQMAHDLLMDAYADSSWDDIQAEIVDLYDEETLIELLPEGNNE